MAFRILRRPAALLPLAAVEVRKHWLLRTWVWAVDL